MLTNLWRVLVPRAFVFSRGMKKVERKLELGAEILPLGWVFHPLTVPPAHTEQMMSAVNLPSHESRDLLPFPRTRSVCPGTTWALVTRWDLGSIFVPDMKLQPQSQMPLLRGNKGTFSSKGGKHLGCGTRRRGRDCKLQAFAVVFGGR